jgi:hypothetical protein
LAKMADCNGFSTGVVRADCRRGALGTVFGTAYGA